MKKQKFTLTELLIAIAIIAILAGMLLPVLSQARERSKQIRCLGNLKECMSVTMLYSDDNKGRIPLPFVTIDGDNKFWGKHLYEKKYLTAPAVLVCPSYFPYSFNATSGGRFWRTYALRVGGYNFSRGGFNMHDPRSLVWEGYHGGQDYTSPSKAVIYTDALRKHSSDPEPSQFYQCTSHASSTTDNALLYAAHKKTSFVGAFADGHAASFGIEGMKATKNKYYCEKGTLAGISVSMTLAN